MFQKGILKKVSLLLVILMISGLINACKKIDTPDVSGKIASSKKTTNTIKASSVTSKNTSKTTTAGKTSGSMDNDIDEDTDDNIEDLPPGDPSEPKEEEVINLGGRVLTFVFWNENHIPKLDIDAVNDAKYASMKYIQEKYNCKMEWKIIPQATYNNELYMAVMSGVQFGDVVLQDPWGAFPYYVVNKLVLPLDGYIDFENDPVWNNEYKDSGVWQGKRYGFNAATAALGSGLWYNKDITQREGVTDPYTYLQRGIWNWDSFAEVAIQTTRDLNGDGIIDQWGISTVPHILSVNLISSNQSDMYNDVDDRIIFALEDPKNLHAIEFMNTLFNAYKVVDPKMGQGRMHDAFAAGSYTMVFMNFGMGYQYKQKGMTNCGFVPLPAGPDVHLGTPYFTEATPKLAMFPVNIVDPEKTVKVISDYFAIHDPSKPYAMSFDDMLMSTLKLSLFNDQDIDTCLRMMQNIHENRWMYFGLVNTLRDTVFIPIAVKGLSVGNAVESIRPLIQENLDKNVNVVIN